MIEVPTELRCSYDDLADVLYVTVGPKVRARIREDGQGILWRVNEAGTFVGATVQRVQRWSSHPADLVDELAGHLLVSREAIAAALPV